MVLFLKGVFVGFTGIFLVFFLMSGQTSASVFFGINGLGYLQNWHNFFKHFLEKPS